MSFSEICIYQVKPDKVEKFEILLKEVKPFLEIQEGVIISRFVKREYVIDFAQMKAGTPPRKLTRITKSVKYVLYWEFETIEQYGIVQKNFYDQYYKAMDKLLIVPHDKYLGEVL